MDVNDDRIELEGLNELNKLLDRYDLSKPQSDALKAVRGIIAKALRNARKKAEQELANAIKNNQRHAEKAVRSRVYSKKSMALGGYITILRGKKAGASSGREAPPTKSGRKRNWSPRTKQMYGYTGKDAQFILYWLSQGTQDRQAGLGRADRKTGRYGNVSTSDARKSYFSKHDTGRISANTIDPQLYNVLNDAINNGVVQEINKLWQDMAN